jgi:hypothetical protein
MKMKVLVGAMLGVLLLSTQAAAVIALPEKEPEDKIIVQVEIAQGVFTDKNKKTTTEYVIKATVTNIKDAVFKFHQIWFDIRPVEGDILRFRVLHTAPAVDKEVEIVAKQKKEFNFRTGQETVDLLKLADQEKLFFVVTIIHGGAIIVGPLITVLPRLDDLPEDGADSRAVKWRPLKLENLKNKLLP